ncbi:MAG: class I SAM-dependent methyltransferase [Vicinamibacterales bacterium]
MSTAPLPPHPPLARYYGSDAERPSMVKELFDEGAPYYEWTCRIMSFGTGEWYRAQALRDSGLQPGMRLLDVATGTGAVLRAAANLTGATGLAVGLDPSRGMLRECRKRSAAPILQGRGESLPFPNATFDMVTMGYALRHTHDLHALFTEYRRVLKPGGRILLLEITQPRSAAGRWFNKIYLGYIVPGVTRIATGAEAAGKMMRYFWDTIETCVPPEVILEALREAGFTNVRRNVTGGVMSEYRATNA